MKPAIGKRAFVPYRLLGPKQVREAKRALRFSEVSADRITHILKNYEIDEDEYDYVEHSHTELGRRVTINECWEGRTGFSVPRAWAMEKWPEFPWVDRTVAPEHGIRFRGKIVPRDQQQELFFERLLSAAEEPGPQNILANATTGSGKTVAAIFLAWQLGYRTLIVVDSNKIARGWEKNFRQFFGQGWTARNIGRVQQGRCEYKNKACSIAMAQSLARRNYGSEFYRAFGLIVVDEVQVFGGPHFSPILHMFPARVRAYFTAENRTGEFGKLIKTHTGKPRVISKQEVMKPKAWVIRNRMQQSWYAMNDGALLTGLARQTERNEKLGKLIYEKGYKRGRNVLVLSNRTFQLQEIRRNLLFRGVKEDEAGVHAGTYITDRYVVYYQYADSKKRNRLCVVDTYYGFQQVKRWVANEEYENIRDFPSALYNRLQQGHEIRFSAQRERYSPTQTELDNITHSCQIILATYEIFSKGVDVPRLDMGVEALPTGNLKQPLGRILRLKDGKATPEWYSIHDIIETPEDARGFDRALDPQAVLLNKFFKGKTKARLAALKRAGAEVKWA